MMIERVDVSEGRTQLRANSWNLDGDAISAISEETPTPARGSRMVKLTASSVVNV